MDPNTIPLGVSSSPALPRSWTYDVFLSFSGEDTRTSFTDHLFHNLDRKGIKIFRNDEYFTRGENISLHLLKALEESRISIIVFSPNYASSTWRLDELVQILQCKETKQQTVVPIFYRVDPSEVRSQTGGFGAALDRHERRFEHNKEKVMRWRAALKQVTELSGAWIFTDGYESTFIDKIVEEISKQVFNDHTYLNVAKYPIGIDSRVLEDPVSEELIQKPLISIKETRVGMHDMIEEMGEEPHNYRVATSTAWIFLLTNIGLEISSAIFDQFFSPSNPHSALISMLLAIVAVIISILELIHKGITEKVKYRRRLGIFGWFYSRSGNRIFGSVPDMCGLVGGISQWIYSTVQYVCILRHVENPYKIHLWPIIFLLCLGASRLHWNQRNMTKKLKQ